MSWERDALQGIADTLVAASVGVIKSTFAASDTAITMGDKVTAPDRLICLTAYAAGLPDDPQAALSHLNVQVWVRGLPGNYMDAVDLDNAVFDAIHGLGGRFFGSTWLIQCLAKSSVPMGQDSSRRWEISHNYALDVNPPVTALRPH